MINIIIGIWHFGHITQPYYPALVQESGYWPPQRRQVTWVICKTGKGLTSWPIKERSEQLANQGKVSLFTLWWAPQAGPVFDYLQNCWQICQVCFFSWHVCKVTVQLAPYTCNSIKKKQEETKKTCSIGMYFPKWAQFALTHRGIQVLMIERKWDKPNKVIVEPFRGGWKVQKWLNIPAWIIPCLVLATLKRYGAGVEVGMSFDASCAHKHKTGTWMDGVPQKQETSGKLFTDGRFAEENVRKGRGSSTCAEGTPTMVLLTFKSPASGKPHCALRWLAAASLNHSTILQGLLGAAMMT